MDRVVAVHSDAELRALVNILTTGAPQEQAAAVRSAGDKALDSLAPSK
jgi:hypothetical protein